VTAGTNKAGQPGAEQGERRAGAKGNAGQTDTYRTPSRAGVSPGLDRVRQAAKAGTETRFTALLHHPDVALLRWAYSQLKRDAAVGEDDVTWAEYGHGLEARLTTP
jgi:RNA-directed DNA polymerase